MSPSGTAPVHTMGACPDELTRLLDWLADRVDPIRRAESESRYVHALRWEAMDRLPVQCSYPCPSEAPFAPLPHHRVFEDPAYMLYNELVYAFETSPFLGEEVGDDLPLAVRANVGTVLMASLFGARVEQIDDNPPWVRGGPEAPSLEDVIAQQGVDVERGWLPRVIEIYQAYREILADYPPLCDAVRLVMPDLQGPLDNLDLTIGSEVFTAFFTDPDLLHDALAVMAETQVRVARRLQPLLTDGPEGFTHQHNVMIAGGILIRADSSIMIGPEMYREQVSPHDATVLRSLGGGGMHSCGKVDPHVPVLLDTDGCRCLDLGQSDLNDVDAAYALAAQRRQPLLRVFVSEEELATAGILRRFPTGMVLRHLAPSLADARRVMDAYRIAASNSVGQVSPPVPPQ